MPKQPCEDSPRPGWNKAMLAVSLVTMAAADEAARVSVSEHSGLAKYIPYGDVCGTPRCERALPQHPWRFSTPQLRRDPSPITKPNAILFLAKLIDSPSAQNSREAALL